MCFIMSNIDLHSIEWELLTFINIRVARLRSTDWKSSLTVALNENYTTKQIADLKLIYDHKQQ